MRKTVEAYDPNAGWTPAADTAYARAPVPAADGLGRYGVLVARAGSYGFMLLLEVDLRDPNDPDDDFIPWKYTWGLDLAGQNGQVNSLEGAGTIGGLLAMQDMDDPNDPSDPNDATGRFTCFYDGNGNLTQLLHLGTWDPNNPEVAIRAHYEYDPYGNVVRQTGSYAATNPWRFSTKQFDAETGLGYWGYRYYSPTLGRWVSRDPIGEQGGINVYRSMRNCPVHAIDPVGHEVKNNCKRPEDEIGSIGGAVGGLKGWLIDVLGNRVVDKLSKDRLKIEPHPQDCRFLDTSLRGVCICKKRCKYECNVDFVVTLKSKNLSESCSITVPFTGMEACTIAWVGCFPRLDAHACEEGLHGGTLDVRAMATSAAEFAICLARTGVLDDGD